MCNKYNDMENAVKVKYYDALMKTMYLVSEFQFQLLGKSQFK